MTRVCFSTHPLMWARAAFGEFLKLVPGDPEILDVLKDDSRLVEPDLQENHRRQ